MIIEPQCLDLSHLLNLIGLVPKPFHIGMTSRERVLNRTAKIRVPSFPKLVQQQSATHVDVYGHLAASWPSFVRITIIDGIYIEATEPDSDLYIFEGEEEETDEELTSDDVGLNCINKHQLTCLLLDVSPQSQLKRTHQNWK